MLFSDSLFQVCFFYKRVLFYKPLMVSNCDMKNTALIKWLTEPPSGCRLQPPWSLVSPPATTLDLFQSPDTSSCGLKSQQLVVL